MRHLRSPEAMDGDCPCCWAVDVAFVLAVMVLNSDKGSTAPPGTRRLFLQLKPRHSNVRGAFSTARSASNPRRAT
jgi:hypothetical protein